MELILAVIILIIIFSIGFLVGAKQESKGSGYTQTWHDPNFKQEQLFPTSSVDTIGTIGSKPKTQTDYQMEHKAEDETPSIDFMHNWIQEKSGKKPTSQKRKPKTTKEWEDEFDLGGHE